MFTYEYTCDDCFVDFSIMMSTMKTGKEVIICPCCKSKNVVRKFNPVAVHYHAKDFSNRPTDYTEI